MKFSLAAFAALAATVVAKPAFLNTAFDVQQGEPFTLKYTGCEDGCTITLLNGNSKDLNNYKTLTADATGDSFTFTLSGIPSDTYAFKITDNKTGEYNYSVQFTYQGTGVATTASTASTTVASTTVVSTKAVKSTTSAAVITSTVKKATTLAKVTTTPIATPAHNSTTPVSTHAASTKPVKTTSKAASSAVATASATTVPDNGAAQLSSSFALIAGAIMAMVYLN